MFSFSEQEILREEISALQATKEKLKTRVAELEEELKKTKELLEKEKAKSSGQAEEGEVSHLVDIQGSYNYCFHAGGYTNGTEEAIYTR